MSTPHDRTGTAPDGGRYPGEQPPGEPGYGQPGFGPPDYDRTRYPQTQNDQPHHRSQHEQAQNEQAQYGQAQYGQAGYGQPPYGQSYGPPPYGQPGYGQPSHGQPNYGGAPGYPYGRPTNSLAILSLVLAFVFAPAGLITGIIARRQIRQTQEDGDGLALAGIIVGGIATALFVLLIVFWMVAVVAVTNDGFGG